MEEEEYENEDGEDLTELHKDAVERLQPLAVKLVEEMEAVGLYIEPPGISFGSSVTDPEILKTKNAREITEEREGFFVLIGRFRLGDVCWSDRVLDPEGYAMRTEIESTQNLDSYRESAAERARRMIEQFGQEDEDED